MHPNYDKEKKIPRKYEEKYEEFDGFFVRKERGVKIDISELEETVQGEDLKSDDQFDF